MSIRLTSLNPSSSDLYEVISMHGSKSVVWFSPLCLNSNNTKKVWSAGNMGPLRLGARRKIGLLVPPGRASKLLTDHLTTG